MALALVAAAWGLASIRRVDADDGFAVRDRVWGGDHPVLLEPGTHFVPFGIERIYRYPDATAWFELEEPGLPWTSREGAGLEFRARVAYRLDANDPVAAHRAARGRPLGPSVVVPALEQALQAMSAADAPAVGTPAFRERVHRLVGEHLARRGLELVELADVEDLPPGLTPLPEARNPERNLLILGLDGADWDILDPLIERGELPHLARLAREGTRARLRTVTPILSPVVWTSVATGKGPARHGIVDFLAQAADGSLVPVTSSLRQAKALWNILGDAGVPVAITAWWATWPAESVRGFIATDRISYQLFQDVIAETASDDPVEERRGKTWPPALFDEIRSLIVSPSAVGDRELGRFVDLDALGDPGPDESERLNELRTIIASTRTYEAIGRELLRRQPRGLHSIYNESTDTVAHLFMSFRPPRRADVSDRLFNAYRDTVDVAYREADAMIGRVLGDLTGAWNVVVVSDHGFRHGDNRPATDPRVDRGPGADWHDRFGVMILWGPDVRSGASVADASVLDVTPTILALYGLPVGDDMDGRVLEEALRPGFLERFPVERIATYERGERGPTEVEASAQDAAMLARLQALGYIAGPGRTAPGEAEAPGGEFTQDSSRAFTNRGIVLMVERDFDGAMAEFEKALAAGGGPQTLVNIANIQMIRRELDAAAETIRRIEREAPGMPALLGLKGRLADLSGDPVRAERWLREAIRIDPADSRSHARLGHVLEGRGDLDGALRQYQAAIRADPNNAEAHNYAGNVQRVRGDLRAAERSYRRSIEADPRYPGAYNNLGLLLQQTDRLEEAVDLYRAGLEQAPDSALLHNSLGSLLLLRGDLDGAQREIDRTLELAPEMAEAINNLGILRAERGDTSGALRAFEEARAADPDFPDARFNLAKALLLSAQPQAALEEFEATLALAPGHLDAAIGAGETAFRLGQDAAALRHFEHARRIKPDIPRLRRRLGELYLRRGEPERAAEEWRASLRLQPDQPDLQQRLDALQ